MGSRFDSCLPKTGRTLASSQSSVENDVAHTFPRAQLGRSDFRSFHEMFWPVTASALAASASSQQAETEKGSVRRLNTSCTHCTAHAACTSSAMWDVGCGMRCEPLLWAFAAEPKLHVQRREAGKDVLGWVGLGQEAEAEAAKETTLFSRPVVFLASHLSLHIASPSFASRRPAACCSCVFCLYFAV